MSSRFNLFITLFVGFWLVWIVLAARAMGREFKLADRFKWIAVVIPFLIVVGISGFLATALSAAGVLDLPPSREWPAGYVRGVVTAADGKYIVPLPPAGRVQLYDPQWHFIRGWNVDAGGGDFKVEYSPNGLIEVFTQRGAFHYSFTEDGSLISTAGILPESFDSLPCGESVLVPTSPLLWVFSSPWLSWGTALIGIIGLTILMKSTAHCST